MTELEQTYHLAVAYSHDCDCELAMKCARGGGQGVQGTAWRQGKGGGEMNDVSNTIGWADYTWNPITGCSHSGSPGCDHCYAESMAKRFRRPWGKPVFHPERLGDPYKVKEPSFIFVCSASDLFHPRSLQPWQEQIFESIQHCKQHTFLVLTKRAERMAEYFATRDCPRNCWLGVTCENQQMYEKRWPVLQLIDCPKRFISAEPLLSDIAINRNFPFPDWIICGAENGRGKRPCDPTWIKALAFDCSIAHIPFWDKSDKPIRRERP